MFAQEPLHLIVWRLVCFWVLSLGAGRTQETPVEVQSPETRDKIRLLNDFLRKTFLGGRIAMTNTVANLSDETLAALVNKVKAFNEFNEDNDPHGEHDCFTVKVAEQVFMAKIEYYDRSMEYGSPDPSDPEQTTRVLTLMTAAEY